MTEIEEDDDMDTPESTPRHVSVLPSEVLHYLADHPELLKPINEATTGIMKRPDGETTATPAAYTRAWREIARVEAVMHAGKPASSPPPNPAVGRLR